MEACGDGWGRIENRARETGDWQKVQEGYKSSSVFKKAISSTYIDENCSVKNNGNKLGQSGAKLIANLSKLLLKILISLSCCLNCLSSCSSCCLSCCLCFCLSCLSC